MLTPRTSEFPLPPRSSPQRRPYSSPVRPQCPRGSTRRSSGTPQPALASRSRWCRRAEESRSPVRGGSHRVCIPRSSLFSPFPESRLPLLRLGLIRRHYYARARPGIPSDHHVKRPAFDEPEQQAARIRTVVRIVRDVFFTGNNRVHGIGSHAALKHALNRVAAKDHPLTSQGYSSFVLNPYGLGKT